MSDDEDFEPRLGRIGARGKSSGRKYLHRVLAAANLARGGAALLGRRRGFHGGPIGRGAAVGRVLALRDGLAALRRRRVIIKSRIVRLAGKGAAAARAHLRYVERDGTTREGGRGRLYGAEDDQVDGTAFLERGTGDRHQFRFIVSAEDGADYDDLKPLTRRLMAQMEEDLGTSLDWVAVDHFNTAYPHTHIVVRGKDEVGADLVIARDYISRGMRERAAELVDLDLGPRTTRDIEAKLRAEIGQERLTSIDRALLREADGTGLVAAGGRDAFDHAIRTGRLRQLERFGLARPLGGAHWRLDPDLAATLRAMGERGDIVRTMQRAYSAREKAPAPADRSIYDPAANEARPLVGRLLERGLSDELDDRHYLIVEATDGRSHYVDIGKGEAVEALARGSIIRIAPAEFGIRPADRTIAEVAEANGGIYSVAAHLRHDPGATEEFASAHVRRLEAIRRFTGGVERAADGSWAIATDHLQRAAAHEATQARDRPVVVEILSSRPLAQLVEADAATWLDRELVSDRPEPLRDAGFGREARAALAQRRQWLIAEGLAVERYGATILDPHLVETLRRRELLRVAAQLSDELALPFVEARGGARIEGILRRPVDLVSGRFALVETAREFTLVPWRPVLERHVGKTVAGIMRGDAVNWTFGRGRSGPAIT